MSSVAERKFKEELALLLQKTVTVQTNSGKTYRGALVGIDLEKLSLCLANVKDETNKNIPKLFVSGQSIVEIRSEEEPFDLKALADRLERLFPRMVKTVDEAGVIVVMDKIRVNEKGIIEGSGPAAERVQRVYSEFMSDRAKGV